MSRARYIAEALDDILSTPFCPACQAEMIHARMCDHDAVERLERALADRGLEVREIRSETVNAD